MASDAANLAPGTQVYSSDDKNLGSIKRVWWQEQPA